MNKRSRESLDTYYKEAETWAGDRQDELRKSRRLAWRIAAAACALTLLLALALVLLIPLRTVETVTLLVDRNTGFVQQIRPMEDQRIAADTALTQSMLVQYVTQRESFEIDTLQSNYRRVTLWSAEQARNEYVAGMQASNPQSPLARYPRTAVVETLVKSVSPVSRNVAMVRFETRLRNMGGQATPLGAYVAMIRYRFSGEPMRQEDRFDNPLGFQVVRYRRDQEALPTAEPQAVQPTQPGSAAPPASVQQPAMVIPNVQRAPTVPAPQQRSQPAQPEVEL